MEGIIVFRLTNIGSKSEGILPFLYSGMGVFIRVWKNGDDSLNGKELQEFDGKRVTVEGKENEYGIFCIDKIQVNQ